MSRIGSPRPGSRPSMLRRPPPIDTKRPLGSAARRNSAARRCAGEPAGRGPSATWRLAHVIARVPLTRFTRATGTTGAVGRALAGDVLADSAVVVDDVDVDVDALLLLSSPLNRSPSAPLVIAQISTPASTSWT